MYRSMLSHVYSLKTMAVTRQRHASVVVLAVTAVLDVRPYRFVDLPLKDRHSAQGAIKVVVIVASDTLAWAGIGANQILKQPPHLAINIIHKRDRETYPYHDGNRSYETPSSPKYLHYVYRLANDNAVLYHWNERCTQTGGNGPEKT
ncbi:hypothetical protein GCM10023190_05800 [Enteractinococcus fodinae]